MFVENVYFIDKVTTYRMQCISVEENVFCRPWLRAVCVVVNCLRLVQAKAEQLNTPEKIARGIRGSRRLICCDLVGIYFIFSNLAVLL